jgi:Uma2 family endonuclease
MLTIARSRLSAAPPRPHVSEAAYVEWAFQNSEIRSEWVDGEVVIMPPVELAHERIVKFLTKLLGLFAEEADLGEVLGEPYQIRFAKLRRRRMPDLMFISSSRARMLQRMEFDGAPDLIVEVVSRGSKTRDRRDKFLEYQKVGVREYWIVDPVGKSFEIYSLKRGKGYLAMPMADGQVKSIVLPGLYVRPEWFWQLRPPKVIALLKQMGVL